MTRRGRLVGGGLGLLVLALAIASAVIATSSSASPIRPGFVYATHRPSLEEVGGTRHRVDVRIDVLGSPGAFSCPDAEFSVEASIVGPGFNTVYEGVDYALVAYRYGEASEIGLWSNGLVESHVRQVHVPDDGSSPGDEGSYWGYGLDRTGEWPDGPDRRYLRFVLPTVREGLGRCWVPVADFSTGAADELGKLAITAEGGRLSGFGLGMRYTDALGRAVECTSAKQEPTDKTGDWNWLDWCTDEVDSTWILLESSGAGQWRQLLSLGAGVMLAFGMTILWETGRPAILGRQGSTADGGRSTEPTVLPDELVEEPLDVDDDETITDYSDSESGLIPDRYHGEELSRPAQGTSSESMSTPGSENETPIRSDTEGET